MTKTILTYLIFKLLISCSTNTGTSDDKPHTNFIPSDTVITFETSKQKIKLVIAENGEIYSVDINPKTNSQTIYFNSNGLVDVMTTRKKKKEEHSLWFNQNGQIKKIKSFDLADTCGGDQFIWFANSDSKSILIDYDATHAPIIMGLKDSFKINTDYILTFKSRGKGMNNMKTFDELMDMKYDTTFLKISIDKKRLNEIKIRATKQGNFRIVGKLSETFVDKEMGGIMNKLDFNLTFK